MGKVVKVVKVVKVASFVPSASIHIQIQIPVAAVALLLSQIFQMRMDANALAAHRFFLKWTKLHLHINHGT